MSEIDAFGRNRMREKIPGRPDDQSPLRSGSN